jgi:hypothetical protein
MKHISRLQPYPRRNVNKNKNKQALNPGLCIRAPNQIRIRMRAQKEKDIYANPLLHNDIMNFCYFGIIV